MKYFPDFVLENDSRETIFADVRMFHVKHNASNFMV